MAPTSGKMTTAFYRVRIRNYSNVCQKTIENEGAALVLQVLSPLKYSTHKTTSDVFIPSLKKRDSSLKGARGKFFG